MTACFFSQRGTAFVRRQLAYVRVEPSAERLHEFVHSALGNDGVLILRLTADNAGDGASAQLTHVLYREFCNDMEEDTQDISDSSYATKCTSMPRDVTE